MEGDKTCTGEDTFNHPLLGPSTPQPLLSMFPGQVPSSSHHISLGHIPNYLRSLPCSCPTHLPAWHNLSSHFPEQTEALKHKLPQCPAHPPNWPMSPTSPVAPPSQGTRCPSLVKGSSFLHLGLGLIHPPSLGHSFRCPFSSGKFSFFIPALLSSDYKILSPFPQKNKHPPSLDEFSCSSNLFFLFANLSFCIPPSLFLFFHFPSNLLKEESLNCHFPQFSICTSTYCDLAPTPTF